MAVDYVTNALPRVLNDTSHQHNPASSIIWRRNLYLRKGGVCVLLQRQEKALRSGFLRSGDRLSQTSEHRCEISTRHHRLRSPERSHLPGIAKSTQSWGRWIIFAWGRGISIACDRRSIVA